METLGPDAFKLLQIIWVNIILSGDNAVVIAMACRGLPADKQRMGLILGAGVAIVLRIIFTIAVVKLLDTHYLRIVGGLLLLWIAVKLVTGDEDGADVKASDRLWQAVKTIAIADAVMSLDNVLAIAAVAGDSSFLLIAGLAISIPLIIAGASLITLLLERFPILVWAGAALLGWIAGKMIASDPALASRFGEATMLRYELPAGIAAAVLVVAVGYVLSRRRHTAASNA